MTSLRPLPVILTLLSLPLHAAPQSAVVIVPVADVWSRPLPPGTTGVDAWRETQVLFGEKVLIHETQDPWVRIEAVEQQEFTHHQVWEGYPGWVLRKAIGDTPPHAWPAKKSRTEFIRIAGTFLNAPYLWGGLTLAQGVDCSGLVHGAFRQCGYRVPRDAHEQWMKAKRVARAKLQPGDLIFSAKISDPGKITHVTIYAGEGQVLEAPQTGMAVRRVSFKEKYGGDLSAVESGQRVGDRIIFFGTFFI